MKGEWRDIIERKTATGLKIEITEWNHNVLVISGVKLLAGLLKNESSFFGGILYHAVGEGEVAWDTTMVQPSFLDTTLENELDRQIPQDIYYIDDAGDPTATITNRIEIKTLFDFECAANEHYFREEALFGGNAVATADSGYAVDIIRHQAIWKDDSVKLTRMIRVTL